MKNLSVLLIINNEENQLDDCLKQIQFFADEIVIVLDKCTDGSKKIAQKFTDKIFSGSWEIEGDRRNFGITKCRYKWILEIDADERVSKLLGEEIFELVKTSNCEWHPINVKNFIGNKVVKFGWGAYFGKSTYAGLFRKGKKKWGKQRVHPKIMLEGKKGSVLTNRLDHYYCKSISDLIKKLDNYSSARAKDISENINQDETIIKNIRRLFSRFWKCYVLRKGYKEKQIGMIIAFIAALYPIISYLKFKLEKND